MGDVITRFKLETAQYDSKLRDATDRMKELMRSVQVAGGSLNDLSAKDKELARSFGTLSTGANNAKDKVRELTNDFNKMARQYNAMTKEMQQSDVGRMIAGQMQVMKERLTEAKKELYDMGGAEQAAAAGGLDLDSVMESLASQFGINTKLLSSLTSGTVATTAAVTAGAAAVAMATKAWVDYNDEINRQNNVTTVTTGLKGDDADALTMGVRALSRTYDVDFRDAINAANTLIQQFGVTGVEALRLLQDGMQGMIAGDGQKMLNMLQQFAPAFVDAGISASQLVAIIHNSEGGLFSDQNMNAILMGIKNIRLMTKQTSDALAQLGIDGAEMTRKMEDGSMTVFEALHQVSEAIEGTSSSSQAAGQVMQSVFGRQGAMQGMKLGRAIAELNTNLEETKKQTGELGDSFVRLNEANLELEQTMQEIFGMSGWEDMNNYLKTELANTLTFTLEFLINIRDTLKDIGRSASDVWDDIVGRFTGEAYKPKEKAQANTQNQNPAAQWQWGQQGFTGYNPVQAKPTPTTQQQQPPQNAYQVVTSEGKVVRESKIVNGEKIDMPTQTNQRTYQQVKADLDRAKKELEQAKDNLSKGTAKSLVDYYEQELKRLPKPDEKTKTTNTKTTATTTKKDTWAPIDMKSVDMSKWGILPADAERQLDAVIAKVEKLYGVTLDPLTMEVTVDDASVLDELKKIDGVKLDEKSMKLTVDDSELNQSLESVKTAKVNFLFGRSVNDVNADLSKAKNDYNAAGDEFGRAAAQAMIDKYQAELTNIKNEGDVTKGGFADAYNYDFGKDIKGLENASEKKNGNESKKEANLSKEIGQMAGGIQSMAAGMENLGMELPEGIDKMLGGIMSVVQVLQGISAIVTAIQVISAADTFIPVARGGIVKAANGYTVPGNFGYDAVPSLLTSGEVVLNRAQQGNIVSQMMSGQMNGGAASAPSYVRGEDIWLGVNNFLKRSGRGEIVTSRK